MKKIAIDAGLLLLTIIFVVPSTYQLKPIAIPVADFYITVVECCIFILLLRWAAAALLRRNGDGVGASYNWLMTGLLAMIALSALLGIARYGSRKALGDARQYLPLFLYFWAMRDLARGGRLEVLRARIFNVLAVVAIYVLIIFVLFRPALNEYALMNELRVGQMEVRVFFDNTLLLLFLYGGYLLNHLIVSREKQLFFVFVLAVNALMLLVMQARSYWIAFLSIVFSVCWSQRRALLRPRMMIGGGMLLSLVGAGLLATSVLDLDDRDWGLVGTSISERIASLVNFRETFLEGRAKTITEVETLGTRWETAKVVIEDYVLPNPIIGIGLGGELPLVNAAGSVVAMNYIVDNGYLTLLAKFGVVGFALYGVVLLKVISSLRGVLKSAAATDRERMLARSLLAGIVAGVIASWFSSVLVRQQTSIIAFLVLLAETSVLARTVRVRDNERPGGFGAPRNSEC